MKNGEVGIYKVNDKQQFVARITKVNDDGTVDLLVMIHFQDFPEFTLIECAGGHAHRSSIAIGTGNNEFQVETTPAAAPDSRVDGLISQVSSLNTQVTSLSGQVSSLAAKVLELSTPKQ